MGSDAAREAQIGLSSALACAGLGVLPRSSQGKFGFLVARSTGTETCSQRLHRDYQTG